MFMSFGKWRGFPVAVMVRRDPRYCRWLCEQAWFSVRFPETLAAIVGVGAGVANAEPAMAQAPHHDHDPAPANGRVIYAADRFGSVRAPARGSVRARRRRARARMADAEAPAGREATNDAEGRVG